MTSTSSNAPTASASPAPRRPTTPSASSLTTHGTVTLQQREAKAVPLIPVTVDHPGFTSVPDGARYPHTIQLVTASLLPADTDEALQDSAQELFTDLTNQFGLD